MDKDILKKIREIERKIDNLTKDISEISSEIGIRSGGKLSTQMDRLYRGHDKTETRLSEMDSALTSILHIVESSNSELKHIKMTLGSVLKNTNEVENNGSKIDNNIY